MQAVLERTETRVAVRVAEKPLDPLREINSAAFLIALRGGPPAASRAFRDLVRALHAPLARFAGRWLRDPDHVQDVLQETFLAVHRGLAGFEGKCKLTTWVYSLAHHKICDRLSEKYRPGGAREEASEQGWDLESPDPRPDETVHQERLLRCVRAAAEALPPLYREPYRLRDLEGMSGEEAAAALGVSPTLIRVRLHRARCLIEAGLRARHPGLLEDGM
jgi:RNA polymerase sigma-70 factor (ECF subfamily)